jgi:phage shock protein PspC (stress-responsive transcriptional regulator)
MTTEQPRAAQSPRLLRRRANDRVIGGVAAGIADYLNIDPVLVRAIFVGLVIFGGAGVVLYLGAWLLIPVEGQNQSPFEQALPRFGWLPTVVLILASAAFLFGVVLPSVNGGFYIDGWAVGILVLVVIGIYLLRRGGGSESHAAAVPPTAVAPTATQTLAPTPPPATVVPRPQAPPSPLGWYITAATLIAIGVAAMLDRASDLSLLPGQYFGLALTVIGAGLLIGSWWGRARVLILPALLVLMLGIPAAFLTVPLEGGVGDRTIAPTSASELQNGYQLAAGRLELDLTQLPVGTEPVNLDASIAMGGLQVIVPEHSQVHVNTDVGFGATYVMGASQGGTNLDHQYEFGDLGRLFVLDLSAGIGSIEVREPFNQLELEYGAY